MGTVFIDGRFVEQADARLSAFDAGLQHAVGLFETMLGIADPEEEDGVRIVGLMDHMERLVGSARMLGLSLDLKAQALAEACLATVGRHIAGSPATPSAEGSRPARLRVRLTVTGGDLNLLQARGESNHRPTVLIACQDATVYPDAMFERGVRVMLADSRLNPLDPTSGHKTLSYWMRLRELQAAGAAGAAEALLFGVTNHLAGGCVSNVFLVRDGVLQTPIARGEEESVAEPATTREGAVLPSCVLPGITRLQVMRYAEERGIGCSRRMLSIDDLMDADEVMLTNSSWGVLPVVAVESTPIGDGRPGELARSLQERWLAQLQPGAGAS